MRSKGLIENGGELSNLGRVIRQHSTTSDAARIALQARAGQLIIGHFSARYKDLEPALEEARKIFPNTSLATEGTTFDLYNRWN
jgi:ribonuclease Z